MTKLGDALSKMLPGAFNAAAQGGAWVLIRKWAVANDGKVIVSTEYRSGIPLFELILYKGGEKQWEGTGQTLQAVCLQACEQLMRPLGR